MKLDDVQVGECLIVFPHEICPVDGVVVEGRGVMDESYLTGEPFENSKTPGSKVLSGAINGEVALTVEAEKLAVDSRYAKIMQVMEQTQEKRPQLRRIGDRLGAWYTPIAVGLAGLTWLITGDAVRFLAVVVIATPCPLILAIPVAVIGAISLSAKHSIIIKNAAALEQITTCRTLIFDKTGTLTYGKPRVTEILCAAGFTRETLLQTTASLEQFSKHPLAAAVTEAARDEKLPLMEVSEIRETPGEGLQGTVNGRKVRITGRGKVDPKLPGLPPLSSGLECLVFVEGRYAGALRFHDAPRHDTTAVCASPGTPAPREPGDVGLGRPGLRGALSGRPGRDYRGVRRPDPRAQGRNCGARNKACKNAVHRRWNQRCPGIDGSHGRCGVRPEQRHYIGGRRCGHS